MCEYWVHLEAIAHISRHLKTAAHRSPEMDHLLSISSFLSTLARSTSVDLAPLPWPGKLVDATTQPDSSGYSRMTGLEYTYGICPALLIIMERIVTLSQHIAYYVTHQEATSMPPTFIQACEVLSTQLSDWIAGAESEIPLQPAYPDLPTAISSLSRGEDANDNDGDRHRPSPTERLLAHCHQLAFAHGLRVYYHTRIQPCPCAQMQTHVRRVGRYLLRLEDLRQRQKTQPQNTGGGRIGGASIMWPAFIAACEADDDEDDEDDDDVDGERERASEGEGEAERVGNRDLWRTYWSRMLEYRIGNIACLWDVVRETWRAKDADEATESPAWMPVLRRTGRRVLAV